MKFLKIGISILIFLSISSCQSSKEKVINKIKKNEKIVYSDATGKIDKKAMNKLLNLYNDFADNYPNDVLSPSYLFKSANYLMSFNKPLKSLQIFDRIIINYSDYEKTPQCLFLKGYIYENFLNDLNKAKDIYVSFINKYPDNDFTDDAKASLKNLGKSPEELIREFEAKSRKTEK